MKFDPVAYFVGPPPERPTQEFNRKRLLVRASLLTSIFSSTYLGVSILISFEKGIYLMIFNVVAFLLIPFLVKRKVALAVVGNLYMLAGTLAVGILINYSGGIYSPILAWLIASPILALLVLNRFSAYWWTSICLLEISYFGILAMNDIDLPVEYDLEMDAFFKILSVSGLLLIIFVINLVFEFTRSNAVSNLEVNNTKLRSILEKLRDTQDELVKNNQEILDKNSLLKEQKEQIFEQSGNLKKLNEEKDYIIDILSHDLKAPINSMEGLIELLKNEEEASRRVQLVNLMAKSNRKANELINKVLAEGALERGKVNLSLEDVDMIPLLKDLAASFKTEAARKSIMIHTELPKQATLKADKTYLHQVFENLVSNAIKFSTQNKSVTIRVTDDENRLKVEVIDQGPGIDPKEMGQLFTKYTRLSAQPTGGEGSTGLGLSLVKRYVEMMGGTVFCNSKVGVGSNFIVEIPKTA